jgi:hypothetical protein
MMMMEQPVGVKARDGRRRPSSFLRMSIPPLTFFFTFIVADDVQQPGRVGAGLV